MVQGLTKEGSGDVADNEFPSFATLMEFSLSTPVKVLCTGTAVTGVFVLSTTSCMQKVPLARNRVYLGRAKDLYTQEMSSYTHNIAWWISYSEWARENNRVFEDGDPDIAIIRLSRRVDFSERGGLALLPFEYNVPTHNLEVSLIGWTISTRFVGSQHLLAGIVETKSADICILHLKQPHLRIKLEQDKLFCSLPEPHLSSVDEGGPVFYNKRVLVGINYWGSHSKSRDKKNLHINILYYKDFVKHFIFSPN
ncbi:hypothetical protein QAD02_000261 [Eretmocerus hayati]|uniref:Uncharacterized protein n=1 Tax=Eretmocerus hayati TaxID=131215 RepID=A0ACC2NCZ0_9HYME|nr:hypothetical protein QAD02_000261 [Eretmocerus hayati]